MIMINCRAGWGRYDQSSHYPPIARPPTVNRSFRLNTVIIMIIIVMIVCEPKLEINHP